MKKNLDILFKHAENNKLKTIQMLSSGTLIEAGYSPSLGFYLFTGKEIVLFKTVRSYLKFAKKNLTYVGVV